jgi:hypothetical protein
MACPLCVVPAGAVATAAAAHLGMDGSDRRLQAGLPLVSGLACLAAVRIRRGRWKIGSCRSTRFAVGIGAVLLLDGGVQLVGLGGPSLANAASQPPRVVAVGTLNRGKHDAVSSAVARWSAPREELAQRATKLVGVKVPSGVAEQPLGLDETCRGAQNRATAAHRVVDGAWIGGTLC